MTHSIVHFEVTGEDVDKLEQFYKGVFNWKIHDSGMPGMDYRLIHTPDNGQSIGGMYKRSESGPAFSSFLVYFDVESVDEYSRKIQELGGQVVQPKMTIPNIGYMAVASDPAGNVFAIFQGDAAAQ